MSHYTRGRRREWEAKKLLEAMGYSTVRSAGSHGPWDLCAVNWKTVRLIQCKQTKDGYVPPKETAAFRALVVPPYVKKELWVWISGNSKPEITILG